MVIVISLRHIHGVNSSAAAKTVSLVLPPGHTYSQVAHVE